MAIFVGIIGFLVVVGGAGLAWWGWSIRVGHTPHCAKCDHNLAGIWEDRCPKCRTRLNEYKIVLGRREPLWAAVSVGSVIGLGGVLTMMFATVLLAMDRSKPLDAIKPTFMVIDDAAGAVDQFETQSFEASPDAADRAGMAQSPAAQALATLISRVHREALTDAQEHEAGDVLIAAVVKGRVMGGADADIADAACQLLARGNLDEAQSTTLLTHLGAITVSYENNVLRVGGASVLPTFDRNHNALYLAAHYLVKPIAADGISIDQPAGEIVIIPGPDGVAEWQLKWVNIEAFRKIEVAVATGWYRVPEEGRRMMRSSRIVKKEKDRREILAGMERLGAKPIARVQERATLSPDNRWTTPLHIQPAQSEAKYLR